VGNPIAALARGWSLTKGHALTIFLAFLLFGIAAIILIGLLFIPFYASISSVAMNGGVPNFGGFGFAFVGFIIVGILFVIVGSAQFSVIHAELAGTSGQGTVDVFS
jgi:hypothetical protein